MMFPDISNTLARLSMGQIGQTEPSLCKSEQMRLIGRGGGPASKFHDSMALLLYSYSLLLIGPTRRSSDRPNALPLSETRLRGDAFPDLEKE